MMCRHVVSVPVLGAQAEADAVVEGYNQDAFRSDRHSTWR